MEVQIFLLAPLIKNIKGVISLSKIVIDTNETIEDAYRRFKKQVNQSGILLECRKREFFLNKQEKREFKRKNKGRIK